MGRNLLAALFIFLLTVPGLLAEDQHFLYDDGTTDLTLGGGTGDMVWLQYFDTDGPTDTITHVSTTMGNPQYPGSGEPSHYAVYVYVWDDPNNDGDPTDAVLLREGHGYVRNVDTNLFTHYPLDEPVMVSSRYFVGVKVSSTTACWPRPLDQSQASAGRAWTAADNGGAFDPTDLTNNSHPPVEMDISGFPGVWMLRGHSFSPEVDGQSFDYYYDQDIIPGWDEQDGNWTVTGKQLMSEAAATTQVLTREVMIPGNGSVQLQGFYGDGIGVRYVGMVVRYLSATNRILIKLQDNTSSGFFDTCVVYDDASSAFALSGQNYGTEPTLQVEFVGTQLNVRIDVDNDGIWEHDYPVTVTTTQRGYVGVAAYNQCRFDDWYFGPSPDAWGGTVIGFDDVPQDYWWHGGGQSISDYYHGLFFTPRTNILESTVYGYLDVVYPWHSADAVIGTDQSDYLQIYFAEEKTHVGFWYTTANGDGFAEAYDQYDNLLDIKTLLENPGVNSYISLDAAGISSVIIRQGLPDYTSVDDLEFQPANVMQNTVDSTFTCSPLSGTLPFATNIGLSLTNAHETENRRIAARINVRLADNSAFMNWRAGYTNLRPLETYSASWNQNLPAVGGLVGENLFTLVAVDVTPTPYNQPPYAPAGDAEARSCTITGVAP